MAVPFSAAGVLGSIAGRRVGAHVPEQLLRRAFSIALALLATYVAVHRSS